MSVKVILEDATYEAFGYYPSVLKPHSNKPILAACDECGKIRTITKDTYRSLCHSCAMKGKIVSEAAKAKMSVAKKGKNVGESNGNYKGGKKLLRPESTQSAENLVTYPFSLRKMMKSNITLQMFLLAAYQRMCITNSAAEERNIGQKYYNGLKRTTNGNMS